MKQILITFMLMLAIRHGCKAYIPLLGSDDIVWSNQTFVSGMYSSEKWYTSGTTVYGGNTYTIINGIGITLYLREDVSTQRVYAYNTFASAEYLLYDFSITSGSITVYNPITTTPISLTVSSTSGTNPKSIQFTNGAEWVEGVGSRAGLPYNNAAFVYNFANVLLCHTRNGIQDYFSGEGTSPGMHIYGVVYDCNSVVTCQTNYSFITTLTNPLKYEASNSITGASIIAPSIPGRLWFDAGQSVTLNTGFETQITSSNNSFEAFIDGCGGARRQSNPESKPIPVDKSISGLKPFALYPNPTNTFVTMDVVLEQDAEISIDIMDNLGSVVEAVMTPTTMKAGVNTVSTDVSKLPSGIYFAFMKSNGKLTTQKFVVQH